MLVMLPTLVGKKKERLRKNENEEPAIYQQPGKNLRSSSAPINWNLCLFCQENKWKKKLNIVSSLDTSKKLRESARLHPVIGVRLACISDLEATKSKYHISCYTKFFRETLHNKDTVKDPDTTMALLCKELENSASHGDVLELNEVWDRYCAISKENNGVLNIMNVIPPSKPSFTDDLQADWFSGSSDNCNTAKKQKPKTLHLSK